MNSAPPSFWRDTASLLGLAGPYRVRILMALGASVAAMVCAISFPWLAGRLLDASVPTPELTVNNSWLHNANTVAAVFVGMLVIQGCLSFYSSYTLNSVGEKAVVGLRSDLYARLLAFPMRFFGERRTGELTSRLSNDVTLIQETLTFGVTSAIRDALMLAGGLVMISLTSPRLSLLMCASFPLVVAVATGAGKRIRKSWLVAQDRLAESTTIAEETLQGIASVKAFANEGYERRRYAAALTGFLAEVLRGARYRAGLSAFMILGVSGSIVLVLWYGARLMQAGVLTHGELVQFMLYTTFIGSGMASIANVISQLQKALGATERVRELLALPVEDPGPSVPETTPLRGAVEFADVHFRYPSRPDAPVLRGLTLTARPGERIALVGASGAGKSTAVSLLLRLYDPDSGVIRVDGRPMTAYDLASLRSSMAVVPQDVLLFGGSIRDNIAYGRPGATEAEIHEAARRSHCMEFIGRLPDGFETVVGERGTKLSGGQRQRIAIARALLRDPAVLILDEATSSLDSESEALVQQAVEELLQGRTAFIIAHRLATVRRCDRICMLEGGRVVEQGTHEELMQKQAGQYRRIARMQFSRVTPAAPVMAA